MRRPETPQSDSSKYPSFAVTVDIVAITIVACRFDVLLIKRGNAPYKDCWALPGGFKEPDETLAAAALREFAEETHATPECGLTQFRAFGDPGRDPRGNVVTVAFIALMRDLASARGGDDAKEAGLHPVADILSGRLQMAFDHKAIVAEAIAFLRRDVEAAERVPRLVASTFEREELIAAFAALDRADAN